MAAGQLLGLQEYLDAEDANSIFDPAVETQKSWRLHLHGHRVVNARIVENLVFDIKVDIEGQGQEDLSKVQIKFLYPAEIAATVEALIKTDAKVKALALEAIIKPQDRHFVKNKTLFPLMKEKQVVFFTLLEGEIIRGVVTAFSRYDITLGLKGGTPITILRHSIYDLRDKKGRCLLKSYQNEHKDWEKSALFVAPDDPSTGD
jgi:hypothetical protein